MRGNGMTPVRIMVWVLPRLCTTGLADIGIHRRRLCLQSPVIGDENFHPVERTKIQTPSALLTKT